MAFRVSFEAWQIDDGEMRRKVLQFPKLRTAQQVADEQSMPGKLGDYPDLDAVPRVGD